MQRKTKIPTARSRKQPGPNNKPKRSAQLRNVIRTMAALSIAKPMQQKRARVPRPNMSEVHFQDTERLLTVTIAPSSTPGQLLAQIPVNPLSPPRLQSVARQFDSWHGMMALEAETTGNAFSKNYVIIRHLPNGDPAQIPSQAEALLNTVEACGRPSESQRLQLDSNRKAVVVASWASSYNKNKPIVDPDANDANNGLFLLVSNGSPGTESVDVVLRLRYNIRFFGPIAKPLVPDASIDLYSATGTLAAPWAGANFAGPGTNYLQWNEPTATLTIPKGKYLLSYRVTGTGLSNLGAAVATNCTVGVAATQITATFLSRVYTLNVPVSGTLRLDQPVTGTTITGASLFLAPFNA